MLPLKISDEEHGIAKRVFNRRTASEVDLTTGDVPEIAELPPSGQLQVFVALFFMYGNKLGALKYRTGTK